MLLLLLLLIFTSSPSSQLSAFSPLLHFLPDFPPGVCHCVCVIVCVLRLQVGQGRRLNRNPQRDDEVERFCETKEGDKGVTGEQVRRENQAITDQTGSKTEQQKQPLCPAMVG